MSQIKKLREKAGLTQRALAEKIGVSEITVRKWESGHRTPRLRRIRRLAKVLKCGILRLL
jgi:transcriptional regulator with XRE-family HTH domain